MCPCTVLGAGSLDLPPEVAVEVNRFFKMCLHKIVNSGLSTEDASELLERLPARWLSRMRLEILMSMIARRQF